VSGVSGVSGDKNVIVHVPSVSFASENKDVTNKQNARNNRK
jgi:hypothetical protein